MTSETVLRSTLTIASIVDSDRITRFSVSVTDQLGLLLRHQWINQSIVQFVSHTSRISNPRRVTLGSADDRSYIAGTAGQATPCVCCFGAVQSSRRTRPKLTAQFISSTPALLWPHSYYNVWCLSAQNRLKFDNYRPEKTSRLHVSLGI